MIALLIGAAFLWWALGPVDRSRTAGWGEQPRGRGRTAAEVAGAAGEVAAGSPFGAIAVAVVLVGLFGYARAADAENVRNAACAADQAACETQP